MPEMVSSGAVLEYHDLRWELYFSMFLLVDDLAVMEESDMRKVMWKKSRTSFYQKDLD